MAQQENTCLACVGPGSEPLHHKIMNSCLQGLRVLEVRFLWIG